MEWNGCAKGSDPLTHPSSTFPYHVAHGNRHHIHSARACRRWHWRAFRDARHRRRNHHDSGLAPGLRTRRVHGNGDLALCHHPHITCGGRRPHSCAQLPSQVGHPAWRCRCGDLVGRRVPGVGFPSLAHHGGRGRHHHLLGVYHAEQGGAHGEEVLFEIW